MTAQRSSPIIQRIERLLLERNGSPTTLLELHGLLRRQGPPPSLDRLRALLADRKIFTELAGERYVLRDQLSAPAEETLPQAEERLFLRDLRAAQRSYTVLDIETSGLDPEHDQIVQLAVLQVVGGRPRQFCEWFFQCDPERLTSELRRTLHLDEVAAERLATVPPIETLLPSIRTFLA